MADDLHDRDSETKGGGGGVFKRFTMTRVNKLNLEEPKKQNEFGNKRILRQSLINRTSKLPMLNLDSGAREATDTSRLSMQMLSSFGRKSEKKDDSKFKLYVTGMQNIFWKNFISKRVGVLKYREDVFRAASKLTHEMPPFPDWSYVDDEMDRLKITKINIGGETFKIFDDTLKNLSDTNLARCLKNHKSSGTLFVDRDADCFHAIHNFYCTGRLHTPPNVCINFFLEELEFWGISADFMEPCCWTEYNTFKVASERLQRYQEDIDKSRRIQKDKTTDKSKISQKFTKVRDFVYLILTSGNDTIFSRWVGIVTAFFILTSVGLLLMSTTENGRVDRSTGKFRSSSLDENLFAYFKATRTSDVIISCEYLVSGFFMFEILIRFMVTRQKIDFFRDPLNWVDITATLSSMLGNIFSLHESDLFVEEYLLVLKLPRIFRLFKITETLKSGMEAFILTLKASFEELSVIFMFLMMVTVFFGSIVFVVESMNYDPDNRPHITSVFQGMWWAFITMTSVGYGDVLAQSNLGICCGVAAIMTGMIICQMPVPIFLKNFSVYYNQASARLVSQAQLMLCINVNKKEVHDQYDATGSESEKKKKAGVAKFNRLFGKLK